MDSVSENWQADTSSTNERLGHLYHSNELADVTFVVGATKTKISGHSLVLAMSSSVFRAMFFNPSFASKEKPAEISIIDVDADTFKSMMQYMYMNIVRATTAEDTFKLYVAADKYILKNLKELCKIKLEALAGPNDALSVLGYAVSTGDEALKQTVRSVIEKDAYSILTSLEMQDIDPLTLKTLLSDFNLQMAEINVFRAVTKWCQPHVEGQDAMAVDVLHNTLVTSGITKALDLSRMSAFDFIGVIDRSEILKDNPCFNLLKKILHDSEEIPRVSRFQVDRVKVCSGLYDFWMQVQWPVSTVVHNLVPLPITIEITSTDTVYLWGICLQRSVGKCSFYKVVQDTELPIGGNLSEVCDHMITSPLTIPLKIEKGVACSIRIKYIGSQAMYDRNIGDGSLKRFKPDGYVKRVSDATITVKCSGCWYTSICLMFIDVYDLCRWRGLRGVI